MICKTVSVAVATAFLMFSPSAFSQDAAPDDGSSSSPFEGKKLEDLTADDVLKLVRYSYTNYNQEFKGYLRRGITKKVEFTLRLKPESVQFFFNDPAQVIYLDTKNKSFSLFEGVGGKDLQPVAPERYGEKIRGTDATYDDLSMRFLYWPNPKIVQESKLKGRDTWLVRVINPDGRGNYATVDCWVDKATGGLLRMLGYNRGGRPIRRLEVVGGKKFDDIWMVDEMKIEQLSPSSVKSGKGPSGATRISETRIRITEKVKAAQ